MQLVEGVQVVASGSEIPESTAAARQHDASVVMISHNWQQGSKVRFNDPCRVETWEQRLKSDCSSKDFCVLHVVTDVGLVFMCVVLLGFSYWWEVTAVRETHERQDGHFNDFQTQSKAQRISVHHTAAADRTVLSWEHRRCVPATNKHSVELIGRLWKQLITSHIDVTLSSDL